MLTPGLAALLTTRFVDGERHVWARLGVVSPGRPWSRVVAWCGVALGMGVCVVLAALPVGALLGVYPADFAGLSGLQAMLDEQLAAAGVPPVEIPLAVLLVGQLVNVVVGSLINTVPALGEELGWRGYLFPRLLRLGTVPAILVSGVVWGVWHAPLLVLGYNYPDAAPALAIAAMCGMTTVVGALLAWVRMRSHSVWPAAVGHGAVNAAAGFTFVFAQAGTTVDTVQASILGWSGWIVPAVLAAVLAARGQLRGAQASVAQTTSHSEEATTR
jgi:membrane protease YdiL (CAAX protease family)